MPLLPAPIQISISEVSVASLSASAGAAVAGFATVDVGLDEPRLGVGLMILFVSLFAVSFPTLSKQISFLRIPGVLFFIGKHFGTGVILATAFIHLLDDAFRSLQHEKVEEKYGKIGKWTGLIILASLLSIFLVEYVSTSYVEHLQEKPSAPPTPEGSRAASPSPRPTARNRHLRSRSRGGKHSNSPPPQSHSPTETTPLISIGPEYAINPAITRAPSAPVLPSHAHRSQYAFATPHYHGHAHHHHPHGHGIPASAAVGVPIEVLTNSPRICRLALAHDHVHGHHHHGCRGVLAEEHPGVLREEDEEEGHVHRHEHEHEHAHEHAHHHPVIGRRRQVVGLLVLQLGIMIHSLVIGLTLAVTSGADFTSLTTAIIFHQLFEGLSLGIRIAALPPSKKDDPEHENAHGPTPSATAGEWDQAPEALRSDGPGHRSPTVHAHAAYGAPPDPSNDTVPVKRCRSPTLSSHDDAIAISPLAKAYQPSASASHSKPGLLHPRRWWWALRGIRRRWLKPTLTLLFGVTTPFGMLLGVMVWKKRGDSGDEGSMLLIQGVMSAISAGMLIYGATVEMIAADFVFGDVEGHHHHHHHHAHHDNEYQHRQRGGGGGGARGVEEEPDEEEEEGGDGNRRGRSRAPGDGGGGAGREQHTKNASVRKRTLAVLSLFAGAGMMVLVGLGE